MFKPAFRLVTFLLVPSFAVVAAAGCGSGKSGLPSAVTVELPDGTSIKADLGSGAPSLANSSWEFFRVAGNAQGIAFVTIEFGEGGNLEKFENNTIASEIFGATILFDGIRHNTTQKGLKYAAATYGAETADASGFAFQGRVNAFAVGFDAAHANATATGTFDPDDPDVMTGVFTFSSRVTLLSIPEGNVDDEFNFLARRTEGPTETE